MLGILISAMSIFLISNGFNWYIKVWSLAIVSLFSFLHLFSSSWSYEQHTSFLCQDSLVSILISLTLWISLMMMVASQKSIKSSNNSFSKFSIVILILNLILLISFYSSSIIIFYFFFEASLIPTLILILGWGYQPERLQAGMYMMIYTVAGSLPLLLGIIWGYKEICSSNMLYIFSIQKSIGVLSSSWMINIVFIIIFTAFLVKLPMFTMHLWLPKAHVEAPVAGSMVLAAILLKLGGYGILRMYQYFHFHFCFMSTFIFSLALWGGVLTSIVCFRQVDLKSLIAYSSVGHMSLMLAGAFSNSSWGWSGAFVLMISHGFCSSALFALANYTYEKTQTRSIYLTKGMLMVLPILSLWWFLFCIMNMAAPPSINLLGEIMIFPAVMLSSSYYIVSLGFMSFLAAVYSMYLFTSSQHGGNPKFMKSFSPFKSSSHTLLLLHWIPGNLIIMKPDMILFWI